MCSPELCSCSEWEDSGYGNTYLSNFDEERFMVSLPFTRRSLLLDEVDFNMVKVDGLSKMEFKC